MKNLTDAELVTLSCKKSGESPQAFAELFFRYQNKLKTYILSLMNFDKSNADDILQSTFESAWFHINQLTDPDQFFRWTLSIARNKTYDYVKSIKRVEQIEDWMLSDIEVTTSPVEYECDLEKLLSELDDVDRELVVMKAVLGFSFSEVAEELSMSLSATKMRYYRALDRMKKA